MDNDNLKENEAQVIGITGSFGSGKTTAAKMIGDKGYPVIYTDDLAKDLMVTDSAVRDELIKIFGETVYLEDGTLNTEYLAQRVFKGTKESYQELNKLNSIVHPATIQKMMDKCEELELAGEKMIFIESALIYEAELEEGFDYVIVVNASKDEIIKRAGLKGIPEKDVEFRLKEQIPLTKKTEWADFVIENSGDTASLQKSIDFIIDIIK